jgi:hypothetical protein
VSQGLEYPEQPREYEVLLSTRLDRSQDRVLRCPMPEIRMQVNFPCLITLPFLGTYSKKLSLDEKALLRDGEESGLRTVCHRRLVVNCGEIGVLIRDPTWSLRQLSPEPTWREMAQPLRYSRDQSKLKRAPRESQQP